MSTASFDKSVESDLRSRWMWSGSLYGQTSLSGHHMGIGGGWPVVFSCALFWYGNLACFLGQMALIHALAIFLTGTWWRLRSLCSSCAFTSAVSPSLRWTIGVASEGFGLDGSRPPSRCALRPRWWQCCDSRVVVEARSGRCSRSRSWPFSFRVWTVRTASFFVVWAESTGLGHGVEAWWSSETEAASS